MSIDVSNTGEIRAEDFSSPRDGQISECGTVSFDPQGLLPASGEELEVNHGKKVTKEPVIGWRPYECQAKGAL